MRAWTCEVREFASGVTAHDFLDSRFPGRGASSQPCGGRHVRHHEHPSDAKSRFSGPAYFSDRAQADRRHSCKEETRTRSGSSSDWVTSDSGPSSFIFREGLLTNSTCSCASGGALSWLAWSSATAWPWPCPDDAAVEERLRGRHPPHSRAHRRGGRRSLAICRQPPEAHGQPHAGSLFTDHTPEDGTLSVESQAHASIDYEVRQAKALCGFDTEEHWDEARSRAQMRRCTKTL